MKAISCEEFKKLYERKQAAFKGGAKLTSKEEALAVHHMGVCLTCRAFIYEKSAKSGLLSRPKEEIIEAVKATARKQEAANEKDPEVKAIIDDAIKNRVEQEDLN